MFVNEIFTSIEGEGIRMDTQLPSSDYMDVT